MQLSPCPGRQRRLCSLYFANFARFSGVFPVATLLALALGLASLPAVSADDYESLLDAEVKKVEARKIDGESGTNTVESPAEMPSGAKTGHVGASRDEFEGLLKKKYLGTFGFYKKLPERSRQEIFAEYSAGAPVSKVRKKIIDRLLQR